MNACHLRARGALHSLLFMMLLLPLTASACRGQDPSEERLAEMRDALLPRIERVTGLTPRGEIRLEVRDRATLREYLRKRMAEEMPRRELLGSQAVYAHLGLLPDTLDLERLFLELYTEQVVGYYDPREKTLYVMEGVQPREVEGVLSHELVHALQDQYIDLDSLLRRERGNDRQTAAQAAIEGHATLAMVLMALPGNRLSDPALLPDLGQQLRGALEQENSRFPVFRSAPQLIRELLLFPYLGGAGFVQKVWARNGNGADGRMPAFLELIPSSTEQVLHADAFAEPRDEPTALALGDTPAGWSELYENGLGELEIRILLRPLGEARAEEAARGWDGDRYRLLEDAARRRVLIWYSVWDDAAAADRFADAYRTVLAHDARVHGSVERVVLAGRPGVRVVSSTRSVPLAQLPQLEATLP